MRSLAGRTVLAWVGVLLMSLNVLAGAEAAAEEITVSVKPDREIGPVRREVLGVHVAAWYETIRTDGRLHPGLLRRMEEAGIGFLVYPGGNYGASFEWERLNLPTEFSTDGFLELADALDATPKISVNLNADPELAARWVEYVNREKGAGVRYWELGDELYFSLSGAEFVEKARRFVPAMKAVDPSIKIIANVSLAHPEFTRTVIRDAGDLIDVYSFHFFPLPPSRAVSSSSPYDRERADAFYRDLLETTPQLREQLATLREWVAELAPESEVEYHLGSFTPVWWGPEDWTVNALPSAVWLADVLGTVAELQMDAAAYWALLNPYPPGQGDFGLFSPEMKPYVSYYAYVLFNRHFGERLVEATSEDPGVSAYASLSSDGQDLHLMLINRSLDQARTVNLDLGGFEPRGDGAAWILDGPRMAEHVYDYGLRRERLDRMAAQPTWTLPPHSVTALEIPGAGSGTKLADSPNLALDKRATASSSALHEEPRYYTTYDFLPDRAVDGDPTTRWASRIFANHPEWFQVDLGQVQAFDQVDLHWEYWAARYQVEVSVDGETWHEVASQAQAVQLQAPPQPVERVLLDAPVEARYVRISMSERPAQSGERAGSSTWTPQAFSLWEVGVYLR